MTNRNEGEGLSRRQFLYGLGAMGVTAGLSACSSSSDATGAPSTPKGTAVLGASGLTAPTSKVTLEMWHGFTGGDGDTMNKLVQAVADAEPNVDVNITLQAEFATKLRTAAAAGNLPDFGIFNEPITLAADGIVVPLDDLASLQKLSEADFFPAVWNASLYKGQRYGIPWDVQPFVIYWNKALYAKAGLDPEAPPSTSDALKSALDAISVKSGAPGLALPAANKFAAFDVGSIWAVFFYQLGGEWTSADLSEATFNSDAGVQALDYMVDLVRSGGMTTDADDAVAAFVQGKNATMITGVWQSTNAKKLGSDLGTAPMPHFFGPGTWGGTQSLVAFDGSANDEQLLATKYFLNKMSENSVQWATSGNVPARAQVRSDAAFAAIQPAATYAQDLEQARFFPAMPSADKILYSTGAAGDAVVSVLTGAASSSKDALDSAASRYTKVLQQSKQKYGF